MRSPARSVFGRVALVVAGAGLVSLALATLGVTWVVVDDQEAALVESAIRRAEGARDAIDHRLALARSELHAVALSADSGSVLEAPGLVSGGVLAIRSARGDDELLDATSTPEARQALLAAHPRPGTVTLVGRTNLVVAVRIGSVDASALLDVAAAVAPPRGWTIVLEAPAREQVAGALVATRLVDADEAEWVRVVAPTTDGLVITSTAPLAPARTAALAITRRVLLFSSLAAIPLLLLAWFGARAVTAPVVALARAVRRARGDRLVLPRLPPDEVGDLGSAIGTMSTRLHDHAQALRVAVTFARHLNDHAEPEAVLTSLERVLREALPQASWTVVPAERVAEGNLPAELGVGADELDAAMESARPKPERPSQSGFERPGTPVPTLEIYPVAGEPRPGRLVLGLCEAATAFGVVVGTGAALDAQAIRHAELLARTAVGALRRLELLRAALTNEKLLAVGRLAAGVAHEMNNPLAFVLANLSTLEQKLTGDDRDAISETRQGAERLVRIVRDLSSLSTGGTNLELEDIDLSDLARFAVRIASTRRQGVELVVDATPGAWIRGDRGRLEQVLLNLIVNAIDATREQAAPRVEVRVRSAGGQALAEVIDNGSGIPAGVRRRLFTPFFTTKGAAGTGLGLYLSRSFAMAHGGDLSVAESSERGTCFHLRVPALARHSAPPPVLPRAATPAPPAPTSDARRVLVLDDETAIVRAMKRWIGRHAEVTGTCDPEEALGLATGGDFALILCDLNMPAMAGTDFVEALRQRDASAASRVVIMTGGAVGAVRTSARVVEKPLRPDVLQELLNVA